MSATDRFAALCEHFEGRPGVAGPGRGRGFGSGALKVDGSIFAMLVRGRLVVKLPAATVDELVAAGAGLRFDANRNTPMREWLSLDPDCALEWETLADDAFHFVGGS